MAHRAMVAAGLAVVEPLTDVELDGIIAAGGGYEHYPERFT